MIAILWPPMYSDFYPRPPRGGRPLILFFRFPCVGISIPALREEGDSLFFNGEGRHDVFLSPPSARRATPKNLTLGFVIVISIPALREEGDTGIRVQVRRRRNFYPRPPRGGRHQREHLKRENTRFLSPPSARRATYGSCGHSSGRVISIPALREEGDSKNRDKISIFKQIIQHSARI